MCITFVTWKWEVEVVASYGGGLDGGKGMECMRGRWNGGESRREEETV